MEMALRPPPPPQSPLDRRSTAAPLVVRPTSSGRRHHMQFFLTLDKFNGSRIVRFMAASSDSPSRKSRRIVSPHIKVTSRGYVPRLTVESSTKKRGHENSDEEALSTYNMLLSNDVTEWTGSRDAEATKLDLIQNASSSSIMRDADEDDEDVFGIDMTGNATNDVTKEKVDSGDKAEVEEDIFEVDLSGTALGNFDIGEVLGVDEADDEEEEEEHICKVDLSANVSNSTIMGEVDVKSKSATAQDTFEINLSENVSNNAAMEGVDSIDSLDEAEVVRDTLDADLLGQVLSSATMVEVHSVNEAEVVQDMFHDDLRGKVSSSAKMGEVDLVDQVEVIQGMFDLDLPEKIMSCPTLTEVDYVDEVGPEQDTLHEDLLGNVMSSPTKLKMDMVDEVGDDQHPFSEHLQGNILSDAIYGEENVVDESSSVHHKFEEDLPESVSKSAMSEEFDALDKTRDKQVTSKMDLLRDISSTARPWEVDEMGKAIGVKGTSMMDLLGTVFSNAKQMAGYYVDKPTAEKDISQQQYPSLSSTSMEGKTIDKINVSSRPHLMPLVGFQEQGEPISIDQDQEGSSAAFYGKNQPMDKQNQDQSTVDLPEQNESVIDSHEQDKTIVDVPEQIQSIVGPGKQELSIISFHKQDQSLVSAPRQKQSIVGFDKQELPIVSLHKQDQSLVSAHRQKQSIVGFDKQELSIVSLHKQDQFLVSAPRQKQSIVGFDKQELSIVSLHKKDQYLVSAPRQKQSIVGFVKQDLSIVSLHKQDQSLVSAPIQKQSIVGFDKQELSIVSLHKQDQSLVSSPRQKQSIVGFDKQELSIVSLHKQKQSIVGFDKQELSIVSLHKQNLSIVGTSKKGQPNQLVAPARHDMLHVKEAKAKDGDATSQKIDGDTLTVKFVAGNLLEKDKTHKTKEAPVITTRKRFGGEHLFMTEDHKSYDEEKQPVTMDGLSLAKDGIIGDKLQHVLSEEEFSCDKDEVGLIENDKQYMHESPPDYVEPEALQRMLQELADKNYNMGVKLFVFPEVVKPDSIIDIYVNRDLTALASEPDVLIKGAFNGWRWKLFTERLHKSELGGVWWSCKLYIPKEAYRVDFVFFNGRSVYENNNNNDFMIEVQSTMDQDLFEDFLAKEKKMELERIAIEEEKRLRQTKEQRRKEEERVANEAIRAQLKAEIQMKKIKLHNMLSSARTCADNLWYVEASIDGRGDKVRLYYNRSSRPLGHSTDIWMHGGYNNWNAGLSFVERLVKCDDKDGDWWYADVTIPEKALVLDWVFADGPPGKARNYDNNGRQDFHAILPNIMDEENYWEEEELSIYTRLVQERRERVEAIRIKVERSAKMKAEMKAKTMRRFLLSQKHIVYTEPLEIHAGTTVDVIYNPSNTVLNGTPEVWFRCSFNLWMHPGGALPPQKMVKAGDGMLLKATVSIPPDAYMMDFVFSESEEGGIYDNRNGTDYHIPVIDSVATGTHLHIVHIAVEMAPIAKVGGLGDVVTSLSRAVQDMGHNVEVILPKHDCLNQKNIKNLRVYKSFSWSGVEIKVWVGIVEDLTVYFLEPQNGMFGVGCVYGRNDDRRFGFFCHSALEFILRNGSSPHIIHCHDWSSAPVAWLYKEHYAQSRIGSARVVFTIHNLEFGVHYIDKAMTFCDKATTVSHTYSREVQGHGAIAPHRGKFYGILNGIDLDIWDPYTDDFIPVPYTPENVVEGKHAAKRALQQKLGLQQTDVPIVGIISRLTAQKGIHLIKHAIHRILESNGQVVLLGSAPDPRIQDDFCRLADELHGVYHGRARLVLTYDEPLSHLIYAGSDFILVPSIFEPCGLTQLVAMRYGSIPVVRRTGGLYDTVFDVDHDKDRARSLGLEPNGFGFDGADSNGVDYALNRAIGAWFEAREWFQSLCKRVMEQDWSWNRPALNYIELYHSARKF